jgi:hypothetical protein
LSLVPFALKEAAVNEWLKNLEQHDDVWFSLSLFFPIVLFSFIDRFNFGLHLHSVCCWLFCLNRWRSAQKLSSPSFSGSPRMTVFPHNGP